MAKKPRRDEVTFLEDILQSIEKAMDYTKSVNLEQFAENLEKQDAVVRRLEIIGEATKKISIETRNKYPNIPWKEMVGMRDVLIHEYFGVSPSIIWNVVKNELAHLKPEIQRIIQEKINQD